MHGVWGPGAIADEDDIMQGPLGVDLMESYTHMGSSLDAFVRPVNSNLQCSPIHTDWSADSSPLHAGCTPPWVSQPYRPYNENTFSYGEWDGNAAAPLNPELPLETWQHTVSAWIGLHYPPPSPKEVVSHPTSPQDDTKAQNTNRETSAKSNTTRPDTKENWWEFKDELLNPLRYPPVRKTKGGRIKGPVACFRCHNQKSKCNKTYIESTNLPRGCEDCDRVQNSDSKKVEQYYACMYLNKIKDMTVYRAGNLGLTKRFDHTKMMNLPAVNPREVFTVWIEQDICTKPMIVEVHYFNPVHTDKLDREFVINGIHYVQKLPPVCLHDVNKTATEFAEYIKENAFEALERAARRQDMNDVLRDTFAMILKHMNSLPDDDRQKEFLTKAVRHWFAIRHGMGSARIGGPETLNIVPVRGYMHSVPRMIIAQFDSIRHQTLQQKLREFLSQYEKILLSKGEGQWFTIFLVTVLFLHIVSGASWDRYRYARDNSQGLHLETRYGKLSDPNTAFVEQLHYSAANLLAHWSYFRRWDLGSLDGKVLDSLEPYQLDFVQSVTKRLRSRMQFIPASPLDGFWEHELGWISHMFLPSPRKDRLWVPPPIFDRAKPSLGRPSDHEGV